MSSHVPHIVQTAGAPRTKRQRSHSSGRRSTKASSPGGPLAYLRQRVKAIAKLLNKKPAKTQREFTNQMQTEFPDAHIHTKDSPDAAIHKALNPGKKNTSRLRVAFMTILGILTAIGIGIGANEIHARQTFKRKKRAAMKELQDAEKGVARLEAQLSDFKASSNASMQKKLKSAEQSLQKIHRLKQELNKSKKEQEKMFPHRHTPPIRHQK